MKKLAAVSSLLSFTALAISSAALAAGPSQNGGAEFRLGISGEVPVICRVSLDGAVLSAAEGRVSLGVMKEFCNNPTGYRVVMEYPATLKSAKLFIDGREFLLDGTGQLTVARSPGAAVAEHKVELALSQNVGPSALAFRIEPF